MIDPDALRRVQRLYGIQLSQLKRRASATPWEGRTAIPASQRLVAPSLVDPDVSVSLLVSFDRGYHASGWWRNSEYDQCWHASLVCLADGGYTDPVDAVVRTWMAALFGSWMKHAWTEPPASPLDPHRNSPTSRYTTHVRIFVDRKHRTPITPTGEVYNLLPWAEGDSPAKVFR